MIDISLNNIEKFYGANKVLENISFEVHSEDRLGIVGKNGCGKSTIFKLITGIEGYDKGTLSKRKNIKIGHLLQSNEDYYEYSVKNILYGTFEEINKIKEKMDFLMLDFENNIDEYNKLHDEYEQKDGYKIEEKIKRVVEGLKIDKVLLEKQFSSLSGAEKSRIILGKVLLENPDVLLLDEPTNHLDIDTIEWLEEFIKNYKGSVVIISHDRYFMDKIVTKIIEISDGESELYLTNFSNYLIEKRERFERQSEEYLNQKKQIKKMEDAIRRFRHWGANGDNEAMFKKAKNMEKRIEKLDKIDNPKKSKKIKFDFKDDNFGSKRILKVESLSKKFDEKLLFENITFEIIRGEKVALLGKNGSGKTTLIKMIMEGNESIKLAENIKIAYLDQNTEFENTNMTIFEYLEKETEIKYDDIRQTLSKFHFYGEDVNKKIDSLSGGEKSRLKLLVMITNGFNFLILDEPTNHLDIEFKEVFEEVLNEYEGTLLFISHDRYFINSVAQRILEIDNQKIYDYEGNYEYYKAKKPNNVEKIEIIEKVIEKSKKKFSNNYIKNLEKDIENTETEIEILKGKLQSENNYNLLTEISKELETLEENLHNLMGKWLETNWD